MKIDKRYVIKMAESKLYCSGIRQWDSNISRALIFNSEKHAEHYIINDRVTLEKGVRLMIIPVYNTI